MLLELHANPGNLSPADYATAVAKAGLKAVVVTRTNTVDNLSVYLEALSTAGIRAFAGVELALEKGVVVFIPSDGLDALKSADWSNGGEPWTSSTLQAAAEGRDGLFIASHPYYREGESPMGDRVYRLKGLSGLVTSVGRGQITWDRLATDAANKRQLVPVASGGGSVDQYGNAGLIIANEVETSADLVDALKARRFLVVEFDEAGQPRKRTVDSLPPRRDDRRGGRDDRGGRGRGRDRNGRGRDDDRRGGKRRPRRD